MTAGRDSQDLGTNAVKWLAATTSSGGDAAGPLLSSFEDRGRSAILPQFFILESKSKRLYKRHVRHAGGGLPGIHHGTL